MKILLLGTYELGRQSFGLASPAAWLRKRGHLVHCCDLSRQQLDEDALHHAQFVVFYLPMHTATRLAVEWAGVVRAQNPAARLVACGLYAPLNAELLREVGFSAVLGPEFEADLCALADSLSEGREVVDSFARHAKLPRLSFETPDRTGLPALRHYAHVALPDGGQRTAGYTEATRGCKHLCRHCPIVPVYSGQFRVVPVDVVLADIRQQVHAGAEHITFGDPDFFNGITHAERIIEALHAEFPQLTYDVTIKIEHLLRHGDSLRALARTGCLFVTSAVEALDDEILRKLEKGHTRADFFHVLGHCADAGLTLQPTFVAFTPWTTCQNYSELLEVVADRDLIPAVPPVQLAIRLLVPSRSRLLELPEIAKIVEGFDAEKLVYPWRHPEPEVDALAARVVQIVEAGDKQKLSRIVIFERIWQAASDFLPALRSRSHFTHTSRAVPFLSEPWYC